MPTTRSLIAALTLAFTAISCSDKSPTEANNAGDTQAAPPATNIAKQPLIFPANEVMPVPAVDGITYTLTSIQVTHIARNTDPATSGTHKLLVTGRFTFTNPLTGATRTEDFTNAPATLTSNRSPTAPTCQILNLDIGRIRLNLLGLVVDLAPVHLDITAVTGPGNLLGNLLCALVGILDPPGPLSGIIALLDRINAILAQL